MSNPYHHFSALNEQRGHQLFYDQVLESYPVSGNSAEFMPGGYLADGTVVSYGKDCSVRTMDQYNMPTSCSTWASGSVGSAGAAACCPCGSVALAQSQQVIPPPFFPVTTETEFAIATDMRQ